MSLKTCRVRDYMAGRLVKFTPDTEILDAIAELTHHRIAGAPVVDTQGELVGMLSETDCLKVALSAGYYGEFGGPVRDYMTPLVETVDADMSIVDLAQKFIETGFRRFPVLEGHRLAGQISRRDVLRALGDLAS